MLLIFLYAFKGHQSIEE